MAPPFFLMRYLCRGLLVGIAWLGAGAQLRAQTVTIDPSHRHQTIEGFGTCNASAEPWWQQLYYDDLGASILRMDISPAFKPPTSDNAYVSPWFHGHPALPGPDGNDVRTYTNAADYTREFAGQHAPIAVMGPDIDRNIALFDFKAAAKAGSAAQAGFARVKALGDFKLLGSIWSPAPWLKVSSGNAIGRGGKVGPKEGTPWPFIWNGCFAGGRLDVSGEVRAEFDDRDAGGSGPTSALTQFARSTAAYLRGFQNAYGVRFYAISIQNELNFEEYYNSCTYPLASEYLAALKAVRAELDKYPDLKTIRIIGPEDLLGGNAYGMWQFGAGEKAVQKNLQYLRALGADPVALAALGGFCIHGYASDGVSAAGADPVPWKWWAGGWKTNPAPGIPPDVKGFRASGKESWMTETSGEEAPWLAPAGKFPNNGGWSIALKIQQALTTGEESAWLYWTFAEGKTEASSQSLTCEGTKERCPKYVAAKHFFRWIRPGAVRVDANVNGPPSLSASAFVHDANHTLTIVLINAEEKPVTAQVRLPAAVVSPTVRMFTSDSTHLWQSAQTVAAAGEAAVTVPGYGVVTLYSSAP